MKKIEQLVSEYTDINPFSGQVVVSKQNKIIEKLEFGYRDFAIKAHFLEQQIFPIASLTKQFTAVGILLNVEQHKLDLNQTLGHYLTSDHHVWQWNMPQWSKHITLHNLLTNSSGLPNYYLQAIMSPNEWRDIDDVNTKDLYGAIITKIKNTPLEFTPGSKLAYNNINMLLLGIVLAEVVCDHDVGEFYRKEVFKPLGLDNTIWPSLAQELTYIHNIYADPQLPRRYTINYQQVHEQPVLVTHDVNVPCGAGAHMFSTCEDLLKWNYALHSGKILKPESLNLMRTVHISTEDSYYLGKFSYGYGIVIDNIEGNNIYSHPGNIAGITTYLSYDPLNQLGIAIMSNFSIANSPQLKQPGRVLFNLIENIHRELRDS